METKTVKSYLLERLDKAIKSIEKTNNLISKDIFPNLTFVAEPKVGEVLYHASINFFDTPLTIVKIKKYNGNKTIVAKFDWLGKETTVEFFMTGTYFYYSYFNGKYKKDNSNTFYDMEVNNVISTNGILGAFFENKERGIEVWEFFEPHIGNRLKYLEGNVFQSISECNKFISTLVEKHNRSKAETV